MYLVPASMRSTAYLYLIICSALFCQRLPAQAPFNFHHIFLDKGLSDARVNDIVQDKYGFMWFATPNGLNRYDGYRITTFYAGKSGLPTNHILSLYATRKGELWIGTAKGPVRFDFIQEKFVQHDTSVAAVYTFEEDSSGRIYAGAANGLFRYNNKWENLGASFGLQHRMRAIRALRFLNSRLLYVANNENLPFYEIDIAANRVDSIPYKTAFGDTCCLIMYGLEKLNDSTLLTGFLSWGIAKLNVRTRKYELVPGALSRNDSIRYNSVYDIARDHRGRVWLATQYFGMAEYQPDANKVITWNKDPFHPYGFDGNDALCVYEDRQHTIWVGTVTRGIYRFNPDHVAARFYSQNDYVPGALQTGRVGCLFAIDSNTLVVGGERGLALYHRRSNRFTNYKGAAVYSTNKPLEMVQCGISDKNGIVWMGTNRLGLMRFDPKRKTFTCFNRNSKLTDDGITDILEMPDGNLLLIGWGRPVIFNSKTYTASSFRNDSNALFRLTHIKDICTDSRQHIWLLNTSGRLYSYDPFTKQLTEQKTFKESIHAIAWQEDALYLAAATGIIRIQNNQTRTYTTPFEVRGIVPDGDHIWFSNNYQVGQLDTATGQFLFLGEKDGLVNVQLMSPTLTRTPQGSILIGSNRGFFEIFPDKIQAPQPPAPHLTAFRVYDKPFLTGDVISDVREIVLDDDQNFFSFDMSAFDYTQAADIEYAYKLQGFDKDWQYIGKERSASYTNVPGGVYKLLLRARNVSGEWIESTQPISIHIQKPFTATWVFRVLVVLLVIGMAYLFYRNRINRVNKEARMRSDYEIKLNELENSALRTQMNPHFIFNSLNTINSFVNSNDRVQANRYISKFSRLVRLILDHSRQKKITLKDELEVAGLYMQLEQIRFERCFEYTIDVADLDPASVEVPPLIIQPFVENSILHGLLPLKEEGLLSIRIRKEGAMLHIVIADNGVGRKTAGEIKNQSGFKRRSHGMEITLKRIELFNKENGLREQVAIQDLYNEEGKPAGTSVAIPLAYSETF